MQNDLETLRQRVEAHDRMLSAVCGEVRQLAAAVEAQSRTSVSVMREQGLLFTQALEQEGERTRAALRELAALVRR